MHQQSILLSSFISLFLHSVSAIHHLLLSFFLDLYFYFLLVWGFCQQFPSKPVQALAPPKAFHQRDPISAQQFSFVAYCLVAKEAKILLSTPSVQPTILLQLGQLQSLGSHSEYLFLIYSSYSLAYLISDDLKMHCGIFLVVGDTMRHSGDIMNSV